MPSRPLAAMPVRATLALLTMAAVPARATAQPDTAFQAGVAAQGSRPGWSLRRTMDTFGGEGFGSRGFFPTRGEWTWVVAHERADGSTRVGVRRFPAAQTDSALAQTGPACESFALAEAVTAGSLMQWKIEGEERPWRRVSATRFVPPGSPARSPVFVEWRREDGHWVISRYGEVRPYHDPAGRREADEVALDHPRTLLTLPLPADAPVAAGAGWFESARALRVNGRRFAQWGPAQKLREENLIRYGTVHGVGIYVEPRVAAYPVLVWLPVDRDGTFVPYQEMGGNGCRS